MKLLPLFIVFAILPAFSQVAPESESELDGFLSAWAKTMEGLETVEIRFRQEKKLRILRRPLISTGTLRLRLRERRLRCTVFGPGGKVETELLVAGPTVKIFYPALEQVEVYDLGENATAPVTFPGLSGDVESLKRDYHVKLTREKGEKGRDRLVLSPRDPDSPIKEMQLVLADYELKELIQVDRKGGSIRMEILEFKKNQKLSPEDLELTIPPGTRELHPLKKK